MSSPIPGRACVVLAPLLATASALAQTGITTRVSLDSLGNQGNGGSIRGSLSAEGRWVAFESGATNLVAGDLNGSNDVFVRDRSTGQTEMASLDSGGLQGNAASSHPALSADGRWVAFESFATNLVASDTNGATDVFVHDRSSGATLRVSVGPGGLQGNGASSMAAISADGRYIAFQSLATNLVAADTNSAPDIFVHDRLSGTTTRASVSSVGIQGDGSSTLPALSDSGLVVAFQSLATNLVVGDSNGFQDIFLHDLVSGITQRVSLSSSGTQANSGSMDAAFSAAGTHVTFSSSASTLVAGDANGVSDVFVRDVAAGTTELVSLSSAGVQADSSSSLSAVSSDGRYVAFQSSATNLVAGDTNARQDIFLRDRLLGLTTRVSVGSAGAQADGHCLDPVISHSGLDIVFDSSSTTLDPGDTNGAADVFAHDVDGCPQPIVYCTAGTTSAGCVPAIAYSGTPSASSSSGFVLSASGVEGKRVGLFFYGLSGPLANPWGGGTSFLCVKPPAVRTDAQSSGGTAGQCDGSFVLDWCQYVAAHPGSLGTPFQGGETVYAQAWFRDPPSPAGTNLTNALQFEVCP